MFDFSALRYLTQAGGAMSPALTRQVRGLLPQAALYVMYGQTEATSRLTWLPPDRLMEKLGSVGIPVDGVDIRVADENGCTLPVGSEGEVLVRGQSAVSYTHLDVYKRQQWCRTGFRASWVRRMRSRAIHRA